MCIAYYELNDEVCENFLMNNDHTKLYSTENIKNSISISWRFISTTTFKDNTKGSKIVDGGDWIIILSLVYVFLSVLSRLVANTVCSRLGRGPTLFVLVQI